MKQDNTPANFVRALIDLGTNPNEFTKEELAFAYALSGGNRSLYSEEFIKAFSDESKQGIQNNKQGELPEIHGQQP